MIRVDELQETVAIFAPQRALFDPPQKTDGVLMAVASAVGIPRSLIDMLNDVLAGATRRFTVVVFLVIIFLCGMAFDLMPGGARNLAGRLVTGILGAAFGSRRVLSGDSFAISAHNA